MSIYCAREFSALDIQTIRDLIIQDPKLQRSALSRKLCTLPVVGMDQTQCGPQGHDLPSGTAAHASRWTH